MSATDIGGKPSFGFVRRQEIAPTPAPVTSTGFIAWIMQNLFSSVGNTAMTILGILFIAWVLPPFLNFVWFNAIFVGADRDACLADKVGGPVGACWAFVTGRINYFLYGQYPVDERWRVNLVWLIGAIGLVWLLWPRLGAKTSAGLYFFIAVPIFAVFLLAGGALSYGLVGSTFWFVAFFINAVGNLVAAVASGIGTVVSLVSGAPSPIDGAFITDRLFHAAANVTSARDSLFAVFGPNAFWSDYGASAALVLVLAAFFTRQSAHRGRTLLSILGAALLIAGFIRVTGLDVGLPAVATNLWGGLLVTLVIASIGIVVSLPIGILLALGRRSSLPVVKTFSVMFIEIVRGVPLITVLFMANVMLPLFLPQGMRPDSLLRVMIGVALFASAYMAEVVRGGLQAIPKGQYEGAQALGLSYPTMMIFIILPQALKLVIPGIVNTFIGLFKDTSLVAIVGIFDLMKTIEASNADPKWATPVTSYTGYLFAAVVYFIFCFGMSRYSLSVERRLDTGHKKR